MGKVRETIKEEFLAMIPPTIFFFITLGQVAYVTVNAVLDSIDHSCECTLSPLTPRSL